MAKSQRVTFFKIDIEDKPGALLAVAKDLKSRNVGLAGLEARPAGVYLFAKNAEKLRDALKASSVTFEEGIGFFVKGADKTGALVKSLEAIAQASINIMAIDAIAVSGNYGSIIRVAPPDVDKTATALSAK